MSWLALSLILLILSSFEVARQRAYLRRRFAGLLPPAGCWRAHRRLFYGNRSGESECYVLRGLHRGRDVRVELDDYSIKTRVTFFLKEPSPLRLQLRLEPRGWEEFDLIDLWTRPRRLRTTPFAGLAAYGKPQDGAERLAARWIGDGFDRRMNAVHERLELSLSSVLVSGKTMTFNFKGVLETALFEGESLKGRIDGLLEECATFCPLSEDP
ncbi:MAG: hypothetical protein HKL90_05805 [Elusimicrobia bacterium]|nr:hypothetical protein [Elusimicrobiota bacterium]